PAPGPPRRSPATAPHSPASGASVCWALVLAPRFAGTPRSPHPTTAHESTPHALGTHRLAGPVRLGAASDRTPPPLLGAPAPPPLRRATARPHPGADCGA